MDAKPELIRFDKVEGTIKIYGGIRYSELFNLYSVINDKINSIYIMQFLIGLIIL